jgi:hypothetical protein
VAEWLAEIEARRVNLASRPDGRAMAAKLLALGAVQLAEEAARRQRHVLIDAVLGAWALHECASTVRAQEAIDT